MFLGLVKSQGAALGYDRVPLWGGRRDGHNWATRERPVVPEDKIISRYARSLDLLLEAVKQSNRAYIFDNSRNGEENLWVAEITNGTDLEVKCDPIPLWFQTAVWDKISDQP